MLHVSNTFEPPVLRSTPTPSSSSASSSSTAPTFAFSLKRGWCQTKTVLGSVLLHEGDSVISAVVHILRPNSGRSVNFDQAVLECSVSRATHIESPSRTTKEGSSGEDVVSHVMSKAVEAAILPAIRLESYPKSIISIQVNILQSSSHDTAASITAASLALLDASVELRDIVIGVTLQNTDVSLGPSFRCVLATMSATQQVSYVDFVGEVDPSAIAQLVTACKAQCSSLRGLVVDYFRR